MTTVKTNMVDDVTNGSNGMYEGVHFETPRFTGS